MNTQTPNYRMVAGVFLRELNGVETEVIYDAETSIFRDLTETEILMRRLAKSGIIIQSISLGSNPISKDAVAKEISNSLDRIEAGDYEIVDVVGIDN